MPEKEILVAYETELKSLNEGHGSICGTNTWHTHYKGKVLYTDGVRDLCNAYNCWELINTISSYQGALTDALYQDWEMLILDGKATIYCHSGEGDPLIINNTSKVDLPDGRITISGTIEYLKDDIRMLVIALPIEG